jgi:hypothetical protein
MIDVASLPILCETVISSYESIQPLFNGRLGGEVQLTVRMRQVQERFQQWLTCCPHHRKPQAAQTSVGKDSSRSVCSGQRDGVSSQQQPPVGRAVRFLVRL